MKTPNKPTKPSPIASAKRRRSARSGFALVVTLTLMVLLSILALGILSLSSIELRSMSQSDSRAVARANAMLALQIAIGELQASAGPDQRITAPGGVLGTATNQKMITGVWKSKKLGPNSVASDFTDAEKSAQFVRWLVSNPDRAKTAQQSFAQTAPTGSQGLVDLVSAANLDSGAPVVQAAKVPVKGNTGAQAGVTTGTYAYAVLDEGTKARLNLGVLSPTGNLLANASTSLGAGQRPLMNGIAGIGTLDGSKVDLRTQEGRALTSKMISLPSSEFAYEGATKGAIKKKIHDLTSTSVGLLTDVANGGLKKDLNLLAELKSTGGLPDDYAVKKIYDQSFDSSIISDPSWARALAWAGIFNSPNFSNGEYGPTLTASAPSGWSAGTGYSSQVGANPASADLSLVDPPGPVLLPTVAKIQMSFALAARDIYDYPLGDATLKTDANGVNITQLHGSWGDDFQTDVNSNPKIKVMSPFDYLLHLVYSPIITLHNPYNVPLSFTNLRVEFVNVPFAFQVFKNGNAQSNVPVPFGQMYGGPVSENGGQSKRFGLTLSDDLLPGEVKVYSPRIPPDRNWRTEITGGVTNMVFCDWGNTNIEDGRTGGTATDTSNVDGQKGWNGARVGYDLDWLCPGNTISYTHENFGTKRFFRRNGIALKNGDAIHVESTPLPDSKLKGKKFSIEMTLASGKAAKIRSSALVFSYEDPEHVPLVLMKDNPDALYGTIRAPKGTDTWSTEQLFDHASVPLGEMKNVRPFALFSAYAKTTAGGNTSGEEGLWVAKPFSFQNHASVAIEQKLRKLELKKGHPSHYSHELALTSFPSTGIGIQSGTNRGKFISGHSSLNGRHFGTLFDVPLAPMQSLVSLNVAQLAAGTYLPHFTAPVGNSYAHPLIPVGSVLTAGAAGYEYADHSFLLNSALFDSYYCSGIQSHAPVALDGDGKSRANIVSEFIAMGTPGSTQVSPLPDTHLKPYFPDGMASADAITALSSNDAYMKAAAMQVVEGAFNVNSISVPAWKAVLSSMSGENARMLATPGSTSGGSSLTKSELTKNSDDKGARFSRFRIPNGEAQPRDPDGFWRGPVDLSEAQITQLAEEIVEQVQERGPFLSMAEFVNRQIGGAGDLGMKGALQAAIDNSGINSGVSSAAKAGFPILATQTTNLEMPNPAALVGDSAQGAPGYLMQSDLLAVLGNTATVRSDTFTIRAYGEALDTQGNVSARAYCEAVVQRNPEFVDPTNKATDTPDNLTPANKNLFGRRFSLVSLRWLSPKEI